MELNEELCIDICQICYNILFFNLHERKRIFFPVALMILICNICILNRLLPFLI